MVGNQSTFHPSRGTIGGQDFQLQRDPRAHTRQRLGSGWSVNSRHGGVEQLAARNIHDLLVDSLGACVVCGRKPTRTSARAQHMHVHKYIDVQWAAQMCRVTR